MYTTPRKVKQESRLRRSHSLMMDCSNNSTESSLPGRSNEAFESFPDPSSTLFCSPNHQNSPKAFYKEDVSSFSSLQDFYQVNPPPYNLPPKTSSTTANGHHHDEKAGVSDSSVYCSPDSSSVQKEVSPSYRTHSSKFPIIKEVTLKARGLGNSPSASDLNESSLDKLLPNQISDLEWTNERKALTLDSYTGREFQQKLGAHPFKTITRRNSLDLEKFIQVFNEEQILMSSMPGRHSTYSGGIDNPSLDVGPHRESMYSTYSGKNGMAYYNDSSSSTSQSLSLSSSNADSLETVIYKTPSSSQQSKIGPVRDWQDVSLDSSLPTPNQMDHNNPRIECKGYRDANNQFLDQRSIQQHQQGTPYQHLSQYVGHNNYGLEYRSAQSQHHQQHQQNLSVQSHQNSQNGPHRGVTRTGNGANNTNSYNGPPPPQSQQSSSVQSKSPLLHQKEFSTPGNNSEVQALDKTKDSTKLFHTKTYNHIKDMISSRFGTSNTHVPNNPKGVISNGPASERTLNNSNSSVGNNPQFHPDVLEQNGGRIGLPSTPYNSYHHHNHSGGNNTSYGLKLSSGNGGPQYYVVPQPPPASPESYNGVINGISNVGSSGQYVGNSYKSPTMSDRKDVNTSFRKAIEKSTQKSNLADESLQMRTILDPPQHPNAVNRPISLSSQKENCHSMGSATELRHHQPSSHTDRAERALDKLLDPVPPNSHSHSGHPENSNVQNHAQSFHHRVAQFSGGVDKRPNNVDLRHHNAVLDSSRFHKNGSTGPQNTVPVISYSGKSNSNDIPSSDQPPPLPTSQLPTVQKSQIQSVGLPPLPLVRENGDGSSVTIESTSKSVNDNGDKGSSTKVLSMASPGLSPLPGGAENLSSSSECEVKGSQRVGSGQSHTTTDSGHGTVLLTKSPQHSGNTIEQMDGLIGQRAKFNDNVADSVSSGNDSEWVDIVEPEIRQILELERLSKSGKPGSRSEGLATQNYSNQGQQSQSRKSNVTTEPLGSTSHHPETPKESPPHDSPIQSSKLPKKFDLSNYNKKQSHEALPGPSSGQGSSVTNSQSKGKTSKLPTTLLRSNSGLGQKSNPWTSSSKQRLLLNIDKGKSSTIGRKDLVSQTKAGKLTRNAMSQILYSLHNDEGGDMTSTTTGLDMESILDGHTENTSEDDDDLSTTIDTTDAHAIRRQLESLESMYTEVLKVLGGKKHGPGPRYPPPVSAELRNAKRRPYGSMSSLPSSVSSRPFRESRRRIEEKKKVKDIKSINRRFQRLESHVVTLARSVAHLSSEMRTQHVMVQEMESIRNELTQFRNQVLKNTIQTQSSAAVAAANAQGVVGRGGSGRHGVQSTDWTSFRNALPSLTNPCRVRKLTKFFGDEPPLIRIFLKKLGYEKYALNFEQERIGIMELPYLTEERLQKMGIPMGPRLRILQEAHMCLKPGSQFTVEHQHLNGNTGNLSVYVV